MAWKSMELILRTNVAEFRASMAAHAASVREFSTVVYAESAKGNAGMTTLGAGAAAAGAAIVGALAVSAVAAAHFDAKMQESAVVSDEVRAHFAAFKAEILDLSTKGPQSANSLAEGFSNLLKKGLDAADALQTLKVAQTLATAEGANVVVSTNAIVTSLKAYGLGLGEASDVTDILVKTAHAGSASLDEILSSLGPVGPIAHAAGLSLADTGAAMAAVSRATGDFAGSGAMVGRTIQAIIKPNKDMAATLSSIYHESGQAAIAQHGLIGVMQALSEKTGGSADKIALLFGGLRQSRGAFALLANEGRDYAQVQGEIGDKAGRAGAAQDEAARKSKTFGNELKQVENTAMALGIELGNHVLPAMLGFFRGVEGGISVIEHLPEPVKATLALLTGVGGAALLAAGTIMILARRIEQVQAAIALLRGTEIAATLSTFTFGEGIALMIGMLASVVIPLAIITAGVALLVHVQNDAYTSGQRMAQPLIQGAEAAADPLKALNSLLGDLKDKLSHTETWKNWRDWIGADTTSRRTEGEIKAVEDAITRYRDSAGKGKGGTDALKSAMDDAGVSEADQKSIIDSLGSSLDALGQKTAKAGRIDILGGALSAGQAVASAAGTGESPEARALKVQAALLGEANATATAAEAQRKLNDLQSGGEAEKVARAEMDYASALAASNRARRDVIDLQQKLNDLEEAATTGRTLDELNMSVERARIAKDNADRAVSDAQAKLRYAQDAQVPPEQMIQAQDELKGAVLDQRTAAYSLADAQRAVARAQGENGSIARDVADAQDQLADAQRGVASTALDQQDKLKTLNDLYDGGQVRDLAAAERELQGALLGVAQAHQAVIDAQTKSAGAADPSAKPKETLAEYMAQINKSTDTTKTWFANLNTIAGKGGGDIIKILMDMGESGTQIVADLASKSAPDLQKFADQMIKSGVLASQGFADAMQSHLATGSKLSQDEIDGLVTAITTELGTGTSDIEGIMTDWANTLVGGIQAVQAATGSPTAAVPTNAYGFSVDSSGNVSYSPSADTTRSAPGMLPGSHNVPMALGGVSGPDAHIVDRPTILYGERQTGREAFIPQHGASPTKMKEVLATAASWYGLGVTRMASGGVFDVQLQRAQHALDDATGRLLPRGLLGSSATTTANAEMALFRQYVAAMRTMASSRVAGVPSGPPPPGTVTDWLNAAIKLAGVPASWLTGLYEIAMHESGGNPRAANNWDSNARSGNPSEGLMQTTISTFRGNALPGHGDIWNPVDNAAAAIEYILRRYHDISRVPGVASLAAGHAYKPYALGGIHAGVYDQGGWLMPGITVAGNFTGHPEPVGRPGGAPTQIVRHIHLDVHVENNNFGGVTFEDLPKVIEEKVHQGVQRGVDTLAAEIGAR